MFEVVLPKRDMMGFRFAIGEFVQAIRAVREEDIPIWCGCGGVVSEFLGGASFFATKGYSKWLARRLSIVVGIVAVFGSAKSTRSKVARNAPELGALNQSASPVAMTSAPRLASVESSMVNLMQLQADDRGRYSPIAQSKWPPDNPGMLRIVPTRSRNIQ